MTYFPRIFSALLTFLCLMLLVSGYVALCSVLTTQTVLPSVFLLFLQQSIGVHLLPFVLGAVLLCVMLGVPLWAWSRVFFSKQAAKHAFLSFVRNNNYTALLSFSIDCDHITRLTAWHWHARFCTFFGLKPAHQLYRLWESGLHALFEKKFYLNYETRPRTLLRFIVPYIQDTVDMNMDGVDFSPEGASTAAHFQSIVRLLLVRKSEHAVWLLKACLFAIEWGGINGDSLGNGRNGNLVPVLIGLLYGDAAFSLKEWQRLLFIYFDPVMPHTAFFGRGLDTEAQAERAFNFSVCQAALSQGWDYYQALLTYKEHLNVVTMGPALFSSPDHCARFPVFLGALYQQLVSAGLDNKAIAEQFIAGADFFWQATPAAFRLTLFGHSPVESGGVFATLFKATKGDPDALVWRVALRSLLADLSREQTQQVLLANRDVLSLLLADVGNSDYNRCDRASRIIYFMMEMFGYQEWEGEEGNQEQVDYWGGADGLLVWLARHMAFFSTHPSVSTVMDGSTVDCILSYVLTDLMYFSHYSRDHQMQIVTPAFVNALFGVEEGRGMPLALRGWNEGQWVNLLTRLFIKYPVYSSFYDKKDCKTTISVKKTELKYGFKFDFISVLFRNNAPLLRALRQDDAYRVLRQALLRQNFLRQEDLATVPDKTGSPDPSGPFRANNGGNTVSGGGAVTQGGSRLVPSIKN